MSASSGMFVNAVSERNCTVLRDASGALLILRFVFATALYELPLTVAFSPLLFFFSTTMSFDNSKREYFLAQIREKDAIIESLLKEVCVSHFYH
jgi:hypothetical protein